MKEQRKQQEPPGDVAAADRDSSYSRGAGLFASVDEEDGGCTAVPLDATEPEVVPEEKEEVA